MSDTLSLKWSDPDIEMGLAGCRVIEIRIPMRDVAMARLDAMDEALFAETAKDENASIADHLLCLEVLVRRIEEAHAKTIMEAEKG